MSTAVGPCAAPRATPSGLPLLPTHPNLQCNTLSLPAPCPLQSTDLEPLRAHPLSPDQTAHLLPSIRPRKSHTRLHRSHTILHTGRFNERERESARPSLFFSELVAGAALMAAMTRSRRVCSTTMAIPRAGWVALPPLCNRQLLLQFVDLCPQVPLLTPRTLLRP